MADEAAAKEATPSATPKEDKGVRLHVKSLDKGMTSAALLDLFKPCGTVKGGEVKTDADGACKGFGFVIMSTEDEATKAIAELNGKEVEGSAISVALANNKEKGKGDAKQDKGKGKKEKGKGKGKGNKGPEAKRPTDQAYPMYPGYGMGMGAYPDPYANPYGNPMMDQMSMQMMLTQQYYLMQAQAQASAAMMAPQSPAGASAGKGKGKGKGQGKGKVKATKVEGTFKGKLKSINTKEDKGFGFIECAETMSTYGRDVFVSSDLVPKNAKVGDQFQFSVMLNEKGQLRATNVTSA